MPSRLFVRLVLLGAPGCVLAGGSAHAQSMKPGDVSAVTSIAAVNTLNTDLDRVGENRFVPSFARVTLAHRY